MSEQSDADELLRVGVAEWLRVHGRDHPGEVLGDLAVIVHFRSWESDETQVVDYEVMYPAGVSYHAALGLLAHAVDTHAAVEVDDEDD